MSDPIKVGLGAFITSMMGIASGVAFILALIFTTQIKDAQIQYTQKLESLLEIESFQEKNASDRLTRHENSIMANKLDISSNTATLSRMEEDVSYIRDKIDVLINDH